MKCIHLFLALSSILIFSFYSKAQQASDSTFLTDKDKALKRSFDSLVSGKFEPIQPGATVLIAKGDNIVYKNAYGSANLDLNVPMKTDMVFRLGSVSKQFTAVAILQLVEQGKISLQDTIQKFIRNFGFKGHAITIENLLTHTSGIIEYQTLDFPIPFSWRIDFSPKQIIDSLAKRSLEFAPGSRFAYSNSNYFLLGYIIEIVSGKPYSEYMRENIFEKMGLTRTYYAEDQKIIPGMVNGYVKKNGKFENAEYISMTQAYAAGALLSTVDDLFKWHQALYSYKFLKEETLQKAFSQYKLSDGTYSLYGYGWIITELDGKKSIEHEGRIEGFRSNETFLPRDSIFIVTLFNSENDELLGLNSDMVNIIEGKPLQKEIILNDAILQSYTGTYQMTSNPKRTLVISSESNGLVAQLSVSTMIFLVPLSQTKFTMKMVQPAATMEFVKENGKIAKLIVSQKGIFEWKKIK